MEFFCGTGLKRPVRLCESTRRFADESMHGKYGDMAFTTPHVSVDMPSGLTPDEMYTLCIRAIVKDCPIRIIEGERIVGSATLGSAIWHQVPAYSDGKAVLPSVSHVTLGFDRVLKLGIDGIERELDMYADKPYTRHLKDAVDCMRQWHARYLEAADNAGHECAALLRNVPFGVPHSFHEAVQSLWFTFAFTRLCGNWSGIGRIDEMLGPFLRHDLDNGVLTLGEAREILAHFFIKGCEWIESNTVPGTGDAQHYQNIVLAGIARDGSDVTNEVTYLVLDIIEELGISDYPVTVRLSRKSDAILLKRVAEVTRYGGGVIAVYNEELIIKAFCDTGYDEGEARCFANDGCWEVQIPGKTNFCYLPFDGYSILMRDVIGLPDNIRHFDSFDALWNAYITRLRAFAEELFKATVYGRGGYNEDGWKWNDVGNPCAIISLFTDGCARNGRSYTCGGSEYTVISPHIGGAPDAGNSLRAIDNLVFRDKIVSYDEFITALKDNWEGHEELRRRAAGLVYYGNDDDEADSYVTRLLDNFAEAVLAYNGETPVKFIPGVSTFGRQINWLPDRAPSPMGTVSGTILSGNTSPTPGTDTEGASAVIKSYCKSKLRLQRCGAALDIRLHSLAVNGENGVNALAAVFRSFVELNGFFMQTDVLDTATLIEAREHPENYKTLSVRVSGWNARFVTLNREWQDMIINRTSGGSL